MPSPYRALLCLLLAAMAIAGGCSGHHATRAENVAGALDGMRAAARIHVDDLGRRAILLEALDGMQADLAGFDAAIEDARVRVRALNARPDATRAEFDALLDELDIARKAARDRVLRRHFDMVAITEPGEWSVLSTHERKAVMAAGQ